jgi:hypothetical protein
MIYFWLAMGTSTCQAEDLIKLNFCVIELSDCLTFFSRNFLNLQENVHSLIKILRDFFCFVKYVFVMYLSEHTCTRVDVFSKIPRGVKAFRKNCLGGSPYFGFYCIFISKFFENLPGGAISSPPPRPPSRVHLCLRPKQLRSQKTKTNFSQFNNCFRNDRHFGGPERSNDAFVSRLRRLQIP